MIADAKGRCPGLLVVPYEFEKYEEASLQVGECVCFEVWGKQGFVLPAGVLLAGVGVGFLWTSKT